MPDDMREIVTLDQMNRIFLVMAIAGPFLGAAIGACLRGRTGARVGALIGLLGLANLALWELYNLITDALGLDTVKNLLVQLALFVCLGVCAGLVIGRSLRKREANYTPEAPDAPGPRS